MRRYKTHFKGSLRPSINSNYLKSRPGSMFFESLNCRNKICFFCVLHINLTEELKENVILVWNKNNGKNAHSLQCYFKVTCLDESTIHIPPTTAAAYKIIWVYTIYLIKLIWGMRCASLVLNINLPVHSCWTCFLGILLSIFQ